MAFNLNNRHFLKLDDVTPQELGFLLHLSAELKAAKYAGTEEPRLAGPKSSWPSEARMEQVRAVANDTGARITLTEDALAAVKGCDFLYADVWVSMGESPDLWAERIKAMLPYRVTSQLMAETGNPNTKFMHCLPSLHNKDTEVGRQLYENYGLDGLEVTDQVFESKESIVFDEAENRLHTIKAVLVATLGG